MAWSHRSRRQSARAVGVVGGGYPTPLLQRHNSAKHFASADLKHRQTCSVWLELSSNLLVVSSKGNFKAMQTRSPNTSGESHLHTYPSVLQERCLPAETSERHGNVLAYLFYSGMYDRMQRTIVDLLEEHDDGSTGVMDLLLHFASFPT
eukprot:2008503-Amphidinium_carterae.1